MVPNSVTEKGDAGARRPGGPGRDLAARVLPLANMSSEELLSRSDSPDTVTPDYFDQEIEVDLDKNKATKWDRVTVRLRITKDQIIFTITNKWIALGAGVGATIITGGRFMGWW